jgi:hypothetical protein
MLLPLKHVAADDVNDEETTNTIRRLRKKRQLGQQHEPTESELPLNTLSIQQRHELPAIYDEFDFNRFLESDVSLSLSTQPPSKSEPVLPTTAPPITGVPIAAPIIPPSTLGPTPMTVTTPNPTQVSFK